MSCTHRAEVFVQSHHLSPNVCIATPFLTVISVYVAAAAVRCSIHRLAGHNTSLSKHREHHLHVVVTYIAEDIATTEALGDLFPDACQSRHRGSRKHCCVECGPYTLASGAS